MLIWLTKFYLFLMISLIECHWHFPLARENNRAVSVKQIILCKDSYRAHDKSKVWPMLNFYKLHTVKFSDFGLFSKKTE